jgi:DUF1009 family protein
MKVPPPEPVGLLAGAGTFPVCFARKCRELGIPVVTVGLKHLADPVLKELSSEFHWAGVAQMGRTLRCFLKGGAKRWVMAGKVYKSIVYTPWRWLALMPDWWTIRFWYMRSRRDNADDTLLLGLIEEYAAAGLRCESALDLCPELLVKPGHHTRRRLTAAEAADVAFGWSLAREMGRLDVGQSVAVRERAVLAVEAIEGTDQAILRAGQLCNGRPFVVVKVAKPQQDMRFDVPTVGPATIATMKKAGGRVLAIEAHRTILLEEAETLARAESAGITVVALEDAAGALALAG